MISWRVSASVRRNFLSSSIVIAGVMVLTFPPSGPVQAAVAQCGYVTNLFAGNSIFNPGDPLVGVSAQLETKDASLCYAYPPNDPYGNANWSLAWTMVAAANGYTGWIQSGFVNRPSGRTLFIQQRKQTTSTDCPDFCTWFPDSVALNSKYTHKQAYCSSCHNNLPSIQTIIGGTVRNTIPWDVTCCWGPVLSWSIHYSGEKIRAGSDIPGEGASSSHVWVRNMEAQKYPPGGWVTPSLQSCGCVFSFSQPQDSRASVDSVSSNYFSLWCSSVCNEPN